MMIFGISIEMEKANVKKKLIFLSQPTVRSTQSPKNLEIEQSATSKKP